MKPLGSLYQAAFESVGLPVFDLVTRRKVNANYRWLLKTQWSSPEEIRQLQLAQLAKLLTHAHTHSPFYQERLRAIGWSPGDDATFEVVRSLPPLEKADLQDTLDDVATVGRWQSGSVRIASSCGTTGVPTHAYLDNDCLDRHQAMQLRDQTWVGVRPGHRIAYLGGTSLGVPRHVRLQKRLRTIARGQLLLSGWDLSDTALATLATRVERFHPKLLVGYAGSLHTFARYLERQGRTLPLPAVVSTAEMLLPTWRPVIERAFAAPLYERYGSIEVADIAHSCAACGTMHINDENVILDVDPVTSEFYLGALAGGPADPMGLGALLGRGALLRRLRARRSGAMAAAIRVRTQVHPRPVPPVAPPLTGRLTRAAARCRGRGARSR